MKILQTIEKWYIYIALIVIGGIAWIIASSIERRNKRKPIAQPWNHEEHPVHLTKELQETLTYESLVKQFEALNEEDKQKVMDEFKKLLK